MRELRIPKRSGGFRTVVVPSKECLEWCRYFLPDLQAIAMALDVFEVQHGFTPCRSPVTNAACHVGYEWTVSFDLTDCFDHVTKERVELAIGKRFTDAGTDRFMFRDGIARQGLPTSPTLCNIALAPMDSEIVRYFGGRAVYTRYADDLTISTNERAMVDEALRWIPLATVSYACQYVNHRKTEIQSARAGRRIITGVAVDDHGVYPTRAVKRRLRAARHQHNYRKARGLQEWCKLKRPNWVKWAMEHAKSDLRRSEVQLIELVASRGRRRA